jgi:hypothetical protein
MPSIVFAIHLTSLLPIHNNKLKTLQVLTKLDESNPQKSFACYQHICKLYIEGNPLKTSTLN